jgi:3-dehydroquinate synthase
MNPIESLHYSIFFENSLYELDRFLSEKQYSKIFILVDTNTEEHCLSVMQQTLSSSNTYDIIEIDPGEENKNIDFCIGIWKMLLDFGADRNSVLVNLGGGVVTDMGSFAASTFKRGIDFVQIPTTLLSQVDASVGGKTGIDMDEVKNIIGTFTQPKAVFIDTRFLQTLDEHQILSGFAEIIKHGLICDADLFSRLKNIQPQQVSKEIIYRSIELKNEVVKQDPYEKGLRKILNFGHTIGHAIESFSLKNDKNPLLHGEAIAIGFICESYLSAKQNGLSEAELIEIVNILRNLYPAYSLDRSSYPALLEIMKSDKKNNSGMINCSLLTKIGHCSIDNYCSKDDLCESLDYYTSVYTRSG